MSIPPEKYNLLVQSYREYPGEVTKASLHAGVSRPTARKAWYKGWPHADPPLPAIREDVREVVIAARAAATKSVLEAAVEVSYETHKKQTEIEAERRFREKEQARKDAVKARRQEADMVRGQRGNIVAMIGITGTALRGGLEQVREVEKAVREGKDPATGRKLTLPQRMRILTEMSLLMQRTANAAAEVIRMERLLLGEPTEIVGVQGSEQVSEDQAIADIEAAAAAAERFKNRRRLRLVAGGKDSGGDGDGAAE